MPAGYVNAKHAVWSATQLNVVTDALDLSGATDLGPLAPGGDLGTLDVATADAFGLRVAVGASKSPVVVTYGDAVDAALVAARDASPPTTGYLYITNKSNTRADEFKVSPFAAHPMEVTDEEARARVYYAFHADGDVPQDFHRVLTAAVTLP
jgi:hypothetical protein